VSIQDQLPKSRITLTYRTNITGKEEDVTLPFRVLVLGDFSKGSSTDRQKQDEQGKRLLKDGKPVEKDLEERKLRSITGTGKLLDKVMKDMDMSLEFEVADKVRGGTMDVKLPITSMKSFHPDEIVNHVPKLKALLLMRKLLVEMQTDIDNNKQVRNKLYDIYSNSELRKALIGADQTQGQLSKFQPLLLPIDPDLTEAATKAAEASSQADTGATKAAEASTKADTAATKAAEAQTAAASADATVKTAINAAKTAADAAKATAADAKTAADAAKAIAADAKTATDAAKTKPTDAKTAAAVAKTAAAKTAADAAAQKAATAAQAAAAAQKAATAAQTAAAADATVKAAVDAAKTAADEAQKAAAEAQTATATTATTAGNAEMAATSAAEHSDAPKP
jgi:type VI secretion system protein ImpB